MHITARIYLLYTFITCKHNYRRQLCVILIQKILHAIQIKKKKYCFYGFDFLIYDKIIF